MDQYDRNFVIERFKAYARERNLAINLMEESKRYIESDLREFREQERSYGEYKTRRPKFNHAYFDQQIARAEEHERRQREDIAYLFGEED